MPRRQRLAVYVVGALLLGSGILWLILDQFFAHQEQLGRTPHPLEPPLLLIHGVVAILSTYVLGWVSARHVLQWWTPGLRRWSGGVFSAVLLVLSVSGFALFFLSEDLSQRAARLTHEALGAGIVVFAIQHWFFGRRMRAHGAALHPSSEPRT